MKHSTTALLIGVGIVALSACGGGTSIGPASEGASGVDDADGTEIVVTEETVVSDASDAIVTSDSVVTGDSSDTNSDTVVSDTNSDAAVSDGTSGAVDTGSTGSNGSASLTSASGTVIAAPIGTAGSAEFIVDGRTVSVGTMDLDGGWTETKRSVSDDVDIDLLSSNNTKIDIDADLGSSGTIFELDVDTDWALNAGTYLEPTIAGDVYVTYDGSQLTFESANLNDGWVISSQGGSGTNIVMTITDQSTNDTVRITGKIDSSKIEIDNRTRVALNN
ncbi:MAG: hypothetical protein AAGF73_01980 [Actinomycetota bacterium]